MTGHVDAAIAELEPLIGVRAACRAVGRSQSSHYRWHRKSPVPARPAPRPARRAQPRALDHDERQQVLDVLHQPRFVDQAPATVYATLLDEGVYLCSEATMYRILVRHEALLFSDGGERPSISSPS
jgi:putative transposase